MRPKDSGPKACQGLRPAIWFSYILFTLVMVISLGIFLWLDWSLRHEHLEADLRRSSRIVLHQFRDAVMDASRVLDLARTKLEIPSLQTHLNDKVVYDILNETKSTFSLYNQSDFYGLLFAIDRNGRMYARSGRPEAEPIDMSDRFYYLDLLRHPGKRMTVSPAVRARTTGKDVFHVAMPYHSMDGGFAGAVVIQINLEQFYRVLDEQVFLDGGVLGIDLQDGFPVFRYPARSVITPAYAMTVFAEDASLGISSVVTQDSDRWIYAFWRDNLVLVLLVTGGILMTTLLFVAQMRTAAALAVAEQLSRLDTLTCLPNRRAMAEFSERLQRMVHRGRRRVSVLFFDIDGFKLFNDHYGHDAGDAALVGIARALSGSLLRPEDFCCRWGGEEFVVILPDSDQMGAIHVARRILDAVAGLRFSFDGDTDITLTGSIGIAVSQMGEAVMTDELIEKADEAMYLAKRFGKGTYAVHETRPVPVL